MQHTGAWGLCLAWPCLALTYSALSASPSPAFPILLPQHKAAAAHITQYINCFFFKNYFPSNCPVLSRPRGLATASLPTEGVTGRFRVPAAGSPETLVAPRLLVWGGTGQQLLAAGGSQPSVTCPMESLVGPRADFMWFFSEQRGQDSRVRVADAWVILACPWLCPGSSTAIKSLL